MRGKIFMFVLRRIYCRSFQMVFKMALPFLPYRNPKIIPSVAGMPQKEDHESDDRDG